MNNLHAILHPTDFSDTSCQAFELAGTLAREHGAQLILLHVKPPCNTQAGVEEVMVPLPVHEDDVERWQALQDFQAAMPGVLVDACVLEGEPGEVILRVAQEAGCDLIVMGTHGRTGLTRLIMGSVAEQVLEKSVCPVVTVCLPRRPDRQAPRTYRATEFSEPASAPRAGAGRTGVGPTGAATARSR